MSNIYLFRQYLYFDDDILQINFDSFLNMLYNKTNKCFPKYFNLIFNEHRMGNNIIKVPDVSRYYTYLSTCNFKQIISDIFFAYDFGHFTPSIIKILLDSEELKQKCSILNHYLDFRKKETTIYHDYNVKKGFTFENFRNDIIKKKYAFIKVRINMNKIGGDESDDEDDDDYDDEHKDEYETGAEYDDMELHAIFLLVNNEKRIVNIIDPNGHSYLDRGNISNIYMRIVKIFHKKLNLNYNIINEIKSNPRVNVQEKFDQKMIKNNKYKDYMYKNGYCFFWIIFIFVTYMLNEEYYDGDILDFQKDIIYILELEDKIYIHGFALYCLDIIIKILLSFHYELKDLDEYKKMKLYHIYSKQDQFLDMFYTFHDF